MPNPSGSSCVGNKSSFQAHLALQKTRCGRRSKSMIVCAVMVGASSAFAAMFFFPLNDVFNVECKDCLFNLFGSLLVCTFFIGSGKSWVNATFRAGGVP